jgi:hypothetical protein
VQAGKDGEFKRQQSQFRNFISKDPSAEFPAEKDRYHLCKDVELEVGGVVLTDPRRFLRLSMGYVSRENSTPAVTEQHVSQPTAS